MKNKRKEQIIQSNKERKVTRGPVTRGPVQVSPLQDVYENMIRPDKEKIMKASEN